MKQAYPSRMRHHIGVVANVHGLILVISFHRSLLAVFYIFSGRSWRILLLHVGVTTMVGSLGDR
ncbi:MAG: hypothetical protein HQ474_12080 [Flammeovirgaceae bacterium]|nr:hypothetical protein [Flammeovirgaceae bacterium]